MLNIILFVLVGGLAALLAVLLTKLKSVRVNLQFLQDNLDHARLKLSQYDHQIDDSQYELSQLRMQISGLKTTLNKYQRYQDIYDIEQYVINRKLQADSFVEMTKLDAAIMIDDIKAYIERVKAYIITFQKEALNHVEQQAEKKLQRYYQQAQEEDRLQKVVEALEHKIQGYQHAFTCTVQEIVDELVDGYQDTDAALHLAVVRDRIEEMIKTAKAATCNYLDEDRRNTTIDMITLAFNSRAELYLSRLHAENLDQMLQALQDDFHLINYKGQGLSQARINPIYLDLRLEELKFAALLLCLKQTCNPAMLSCSGSSLKPILT